MLLMCMCNRAARFCHAASHGGQVTAPYDLIQRVIRTWTGNTARLPSGAEMHGQPLHVQVPEKTDPGLLPWQAPALSSSHGASGSRNVQSALRLRYNSRGNSCRNTAAWVFTRACTTWRLSQTGLQLIWLSWLVRAVQDLLLRAEAIHKVHGKMRT